MNIRELAAEAGFLDADDKGVWITDGLWDKELTRFAELVVANIDPKSFMTYHEGYAAGVAHEREECAKVCDGLADMHEKMNQWGQFKTAETLTQAIKARSKA
jgi:hypothetical protein